MQKQKMCLAVLILSGVFFILGAQNSQAVGPTVIDSSVNIDGVWTKEGSPYVISGNVSVRKDLEIKPGTVVKFMPGSVLRALEKFIAKGDKNERIIFTSIFDDNVAGDTNGDGNATVPIRGSGGSVFFYNSKKEVLMENASVFHGGTISNAAISVRTFGNNVIVRHSIFKNNYAAFEIYQSQPTIEFNEISDNVLAVRVRILKDTKLENNAMYNNINGIIAIYPTIATLDARNNWWGDVSGPYFYGMWGSDNRNGKGNAVSSGVIFNPWLNSNPVVLEESKDEGCQENCFSNVMFLPGIKASRLYKDGALGTQDKLWPPNYFGNDVEDLFLDKDGKSLNDVYTRDVLDEVAIPGIGGNIYKTFLSEMEKLKDDGAINDFQSFAYDWRQSVEDVAKNGTPYKDNATKNAVVDLQALAESSKSKKVTLVAHSNGGLVAKAMMLELERLGMQDLVDKIIFVGTPQLGTPLATLSLLYGYDESSPFGWLISRKSARLLAENMPGAYGLLPSEKYFERMEKPFINFSSEKTRFKDFRDAYGENINSYQEFKKFLLGIDDDREKPEMSEVEMENVLNADLLEEASEIHNRLDAWTPPETVEVIQIAGWGLDTVSGVTYAEKEMTKCVAVSGAKVPACINTGKYEPVYEPEFTVDGDKVVVTPSALMFSEGDDIKKYWFNLFNYNTDPLFNKKNNHGNIFETSSIRQIIKNEIVSSSSLPEYVKMSRPNDYENASSRLRMSLYSPLDIHLYDEAGNHTGPKKVEIEGQEKIVFEENIPNSYYYQMGERKYVGFPADQKIRVKMEGYALGSYTLKLEEVKENAQGEEVLARAVFSDLPVTENTTVNFNFQENGLASMTPIEADVDSDGKNDYVVEKNLNGVAEIPLTVEMISQKIDLYAQIGLISDSKTQEFLQVKIRELSGVEEMISKLDEKKNENPKNNQIELFNKKIDDIISLIEKKFQESILSPARETLIKNLESIKK